MATKEEVIHALYTLSVEDRLDVQRLLNDELDGLDDEPGPDDARAAEEWTAELERRIAAIESGQSKGRPWQEVLDELRAEIAQEFAGRGHAAHHP
jgi:putative addiction module component (TIGR02574 family)